MVKPECNICGVEYIDGYDGPCQEPRGRFDPSIGRFTEHCRGTVSYRVTAERLERELLALRETLREHHAAEKVTGCYVCNTCAMCLTERRTRGHCTNCGERADARQLQEIYGPEIYRS